MGAPFKDGRGKGNVGGDHQITVGHLFDDMGIGHIEAGRNLDGTDEA